MQFSVSQIFNFKPQVFTKKWQKLIASFCDCNAGVYRARMIREGMTNNEHLTDSMVTAAKTLQSKLGDSGVSLSLLSILAHLLS